MDNADKSDDGEKSHFLAAFFWFVLMGRNHYILIAMKSNNANHLEGIATSVNQYLEWGLDWA